jgi:hypothetical protein
MGRCTDRTIASNTTGEATRLLLTFVLISFLGLFGAVTPALAVTVTEFESVSEEQQGQWLAVQVLLLKDWCKNNGYEDLVVPI